MTDMLPRAEPADTISRRRVLLSAATVGTAACMTAGLPGQAAAAMAAAGSPDRRLHTHTSRYVLADGETLTGFFAIPRSFDPVDVVVMMPGAGGITDAVRATAQRQALGGALVVVPDLAASADPAVRRSDHQAMMADVATRIHGFRTHPRSSGRLTIVAA